MPGIDIRVDDPVIRVDDGTNQIMVDSAYVVDSFMVATGGVQGQPVIIQGVANATADGQGGNRLRQGG